MTYIAHKNGELFTVCNAAQIIAFNVPRSAANAALLEAGVSDPDSVLDTQAEPSTFWPTLISAFNADRQAALEQNEELRAHVDALSDALNEVATELEGSNAEQFLEKHVAQLEAKLRANIPGYRIWLTQNTFPSFDVNNDSLVRSWAMQNTELGKQITQLKGVLANG